ncbi:hypothetical protein D3C78_783650 [compost metagenome]
MSIRTRSSLMAAFLLLTSALFPSISHAAPTSSPSPNTIKYTIVSSAENRGDTAPEELRKFASIVIQELSQQQPFTAWSKAITTIEPLGPGSHSWLVTIQDRESNSTSSSSGYLIISMTESGDYKLIEYGLGPDSIYARPTLESALNHSGLTLNKKHNWEVVPVYSGPVLAEWAISQAGTSKVEHYLDALTGELLPENESSWELQSSRYVPPVRAAGSGPSIHPKPDPLVHTSESFDPYDNILWMVGNALNVKFESFENVLEKHKSLIFVSSGQDRTYSVPLPIFGYQKWSLNSDSTLYIMSGSESSPRFISLQALTDSGEFIKYK